MARESDSFSDEQLVAYLDDELDQPLRRSIEAALTRDPSLTQRLAALEIDRAAVCGVFDDVLGAAPHADVPPLSSRPRERRADSRAWTRRGAVAAGVLVVALAGFGAGYVLHRGPSADWRTAVADYQVLYTADTLAAVRLGRDEREEQLRRVSARVGFPVSADSVVLPSLSYRRAQILGHRGTPLAQLAYVDARGGPVALCFLRTGEPDSAPAAATLRGLETVSWSRNGFGFLLIGQTSKRDLVAVAEAFIRRNS